MKIIKNYLIISLLALLILGLAAGPVGAVTPVTACGTISSAGDYVLTQNLINSSVVNECIGITSSNVVFDGAGYTIDGLDIPFVDGIFVRLDLTNVTVKNVILTDWDYGLMYKNVSNGTITNVTARSNLEGIVLKYSSSNNVTGNTAYNNTIDGILLNLSSSNTITNNNASSNTVDGIHLTDSRDNTFTDNFIRNNIRWDFFSKTNSTNNTVTNLTIGIGPTITFTSKDVAIRSVTPSTIPIDPTGNQSIRKHVNATNNSADSWLFLNISYSNSDVAGVVNESSLRMWNFTSGTWSQVSGPTNGVNTLLNYVFANITQTPFSGIFAPIGTPEFSFTGYSYNETNVPLNNTNVTIEVYQFGGGGPPTLVGSVSTSSNVSGYFSVAINGSLNNPQYMYKPVLKHFANNATSGTLDWIGQVLPQFPRDMIRFLTADSPMSFYLRRGGTINIRARNDINNESTRVAFQYMIKDTRLGYPITENFTGEQENVNNLYVPLERNYSIMIFPNRSLPISYDLTTNEFNSTNNNVTITFNTSIRPRWVFGYALKNDTTAGFENLNVIAYLMEPGNIIGKDRPMPSNMSAFRPPSEPVRSDQYTNSTGFFNITLPGSAQGSGANILLFVMARIGTDYYGVFKNITVNYSESSVQLPNITVWPLLGNVENINVTNVGIMGPEQSIPVKQLPFQLINGSDNTNITNQRAHVEIEVNYSVNNSASFKWMVDVSQTANGSFSIPAINANIRKINVFMQNYAPLKTSKNTSQIAARPVNITMTSFDNRKPDGNKSSAPIFIDMLLSKPECDVPVPASGCSLMPDPTTGMAEASFDPFKTVLGGGKISMRIKQTSTRITVHYKNVDMLASGPPDALFDESAINTTSGSTLAQAWKFGSKGPEIYEEVLIGVPISSSLSAPSVKLGKLYDENWNAIWDINTNSSTQVPSDYNQFPSTWFENGYSCTTNTSSKCYIDSTNGTLWLTIPHFSGVGPTISGTTSTTTTSSSGSSSGSTGGGGVVTSEPYTNIEKAERYDKNLIANTPVTYTFKAPELSIYEIAVTGKESENDIALRVEALKGTSTLVKAAPPGTVYKNVNIWAGTKRIKEALIRFKVENSWLGSNNLAGSDVKLVKWDGSQWVQLETTEKTKDSSFTYYEAKTDTFSVFAITGLKGGVIVPTATPAIEVTATPAISAETPKAPTAIPTEKAPGFERGLAVATLLAVYIFRRKKQ